MSSEVGSGHISIFPVMTGFKSRVTRETQAAGAAGAKTFEGGFKGAGRATGRSLGRDLKAALSASAGDMGAAQTRKLTGAVASASAALAKVRLKQQDDAGRVRVAEVKLAEAIKRSGAESSQAASAEERLASARRTHASTTVAVTSATSRLKSAQQALATAQAATERSAGRAAGGLRGMLGSVRSGLSGLGSATSSALGNVVSAASRAGSAAGRALSTGITTAATAGVSAAAAGIGIAFGKGFARLNAIDTAQAKLRGLGNDAKTVDAIMSDALSSVRGTAFGLGEAATVAASAVAAGIKPGQALQGHLKSIANNASAAGISMEEMGAIFNKAATQANGVQNDVISQLADRGIPIYQALADQMGVTAGEVFKMASKGEVDFETFSKAATAAAGTVAKEMGNTVPGAGKNFFAAMGRIGANALQPIYGKLAPLIKAATSALAPIEERAKAFGGLLLQVVGPALDWLTTLFTRIGEGASLADAGLGRFAGLLAPITAGLAALGAGGVGSLLSRLPLLGGMFTGVAGPLAALTGPLGIVTAMLAAFFATGGDAGSLVTTITGIVTSVVTALPGLVSTVATLVPQIVATILGQVPALLTAATSIVMTLVTGLVSSIPVLIEGAVTLLGGLIDAIVSNLPMIIAGAITLVTALLGGIITALPLIIEGALALVSGLLTGIVQALPVIIQGGIQLLMALITGIITALPMLIEAAIGLVMGLLQAIIDNLPMIIEAGINLVISLLTGLIEALPMLIEAAINLIVQVITGLLTMLPQLIEAGITLVIALITGLIEAIPQIIEMLPQIIEAIWTGLTEVDWLGLGAQIIQGIIDGFFSMVGAVGDAIGSVVGGILEFFPNSPAKKGPLSNAGWSKLKGSGAATMEQFTAGAQAGSDGFGAALESAASGASARAQVAVSSAAVGGAPAGEGGSAAAGRAAIVQHNNFAHQDPAVGAELAGQALSSAISRAGG